MRTNKTLACLAIILWSTWNAGAAPVLPQGPKLTVEQLSLRGLNTLRIEVMPVTKELRKAGISVERLTKIFSEQVAASDMHVVDRSDAPLAGLVVFGATDADQPGAVAVTFVIAFHQEIVLKRIDAHITAPTAFFTQTKLTTEARARSVVEWEVREMTRRVVKITHQATSKR